MSKRSRPAPSRRVTSKVRSAEVARPTRVVAIGDLHGSFDALIHNLLSLNLIDNKGWIGGNECLVILGDILADRKVKSFLVLERIKDLRRQARAKGGDIITIAGNHDDFALSMLLDKRMSGIHLKISEKPYLDQSQGIMEFGEFLPNPTTSEPGNSTDYHQGSDIYNRYHEIIQRRQDILKVMRGDQKGKEILKSIMEMKLVEQIDDTLFVHTNITSNMAQMILDNGIDAINSAYQTALKKALFDDEELPNDVVMLMDIFLSTNNRSYMSEKYADQLRKKGINRVMHGHTNMTQRDRIVGGKKTPAFDEINKMVVVSVDRGHGLCGEQDKRSIGTIEKDGSIRIGEELSLIKKGRSKMINESRAGIVKLLSSVFSNVSDFIKNKIFNSDSPQATFSQLIFPESFVPQGSPEPSEGIEPSDDFLDVFQSADIPRKPTDQTTMLIPVIGPENVGGATTSIDLGVPLNTTEIRALDAEEHANSDVLANAEKKMILGVDPSDYDETKYVILHEHHVPDGESHFIKIVPHGAKITIGDNAKLEIGMVGHGTQIKIGDASTVTIDSVALYGPQKQILIKLPESSFIDYEDATGNKGLITVKRD